MDRQRTLTFSPGLFSLGEKVVLPGEGIWVVVCIERCGQSDQVTLLKEGTCPNCGQAELQLGELFCHCCQESLAAEAEFWESEEGEHTLLKDLRERISMGLSSAEVQTGRFLPKED